VKYAAVGSCIYCGVSSEALPSGRFLSSEHIIPEGLGGTQEVPDASCSNCAVITSTFERSCLREYFQHARAYLNAYGKRRPDKRPRDFPAALKVGDGNQESVRVPLQDYPFWCMMLTMPPPGILIGRPKEADRQGVLCHPIMISERGHESKMVGIIGSNPGTRTVELTCRLSPGEFWKLLAKVAYSFAVAKYGYNSFEPFLKEFILGLDEFVGPHFIGGAYSAENLPVESIGSFPGLHEARLLTIEFGGRRLLVCRLQLFAPLLAPVYDVVVGSI
jgi:hypothetical protein